MTKVSGGMTDDELADELMGLDADTRDKEFAEALRKSGEQRAPVVLTKFFPRPFTERLLAIRDFLYEGERGVLYHCNPDIPLWRTDGEDFIRHHLRTTTDCIEDALKKTHFIEEIIADVQGVTYRPGGLPEPDVNLIPFKNGVYDISTDEFRPFRKDDYFTWTLPWNYNRTASCMYLKNLINNTLPDPGFLWDLMAYCLYRGYPLQKFFILIGRGRNGKGLFLTILVRLLGSTLVSNISISELESNRFAASALYRCLANISSEENYGDLENTRILKMLTGGDQVQADVKYKRPVRFINYAKIIFAANQLPQTRDTTDAFFRRIALQEFPYQFNIDPSIDIKIRENSDEMTREFEGLLFLVIQRLKELKFRNFIFAGAHDFESTRAKYLMLSNPLIQFLDETVERTHELCDYIFKFEFRDTLNVWLREHGFNSYPDNRLGRELKELGFEDGRKDFDGQKRYFAWVGVRWKDSSVRAVKDVKVLYNNSLENKEKCYKRGDNLDKTLNNQPILDGE